MKDTYILVIIISLKADMIFAFILCYTVKILKFGTPQTIAIFVLKIEKFVVTLH